MSQEPTFVVTEYDPAWRRTFEQLRRRIHRLLEDLDVSIEHVGSTAVPGLAAKPVIDIDVVVPGASIVPTVVERLSASGYVSEGDLGVAGREALKPPPHGPYHHLYVVVRGSTAYRDHIDLRDHLRRNAEDADTYAARKREVAPLYDVDRDAYAQAKKELIEELLQKARREASGGKT